MVTRFPMHTGQMSNLGLAACLLLAGCSSLSAKDYMVMQEALKEEAAQAQRTAAGLHTQVQTLQEQLGASRAAQARLQGELRDSDRRLIEAQRIAEGHREELAKVKDEREQFAQTSHQLRQRVADADLEQKRMRVLQTSIKKLTKEVATLNTAVRDALGKSKPAAVSADELVDTFLAEHLKESRVLIVKPGDTLFSLAKKYAVDLVDLKYINRLRGDRIFAGQLLVVPDP